MISKCAHLYMNCTFFYYTDSKNAFLKRGKKVYHTKLCNKQIQIWSLLLTLPLFIGCLTRYALPGYWIMMMCNFFWTTCKTRCSSSNIRVSQLWIFFFTAYFSLVNSLSDWPPSIYLQLDSINKPCHMWIAFLGKGLSLLFFQNGSQGFFLFNE